MTDASWSREGNNLLQYKEVREHLEHLRIAHARMMGQPVPSLRDRHERMMRAASARPARKPRAPKKVSTTIRMHPEVLEAFKAEGEGWQTRINEVLLEYVGKSVVGE